MTRNRSAAVPAILATLALGAVIWIVAAQRSTPGSGPEGSTTQSPSFTNAFAVDTSRTVRFRADAEALESLSDEAIEDQLRDWLLYAVLAESGLSGEGVRNTLYDLPPTRASYVAPVAAFDFGVTRFRVVDDLGTVVALVPAGSADQRDLLAQIGDAARTRLGSAPPTVQVFEYTIDPVAFSAHVARVADIAGARLFTADYGYVQKDVRDVSDLEAFLAGTSDLVSAEPVSGGVRLAGRRVSGAKARKLRLEDVAALWQSEAEIGQRRKLVDEYEARWKDEDYPKKLLEEVFNRERAELLVRFPSLDTPTERPLETSAATAKRVFEARWADEKHVQRVLKEAHARELEDLRQQLGPAGRALAPGSGFSLDPAFDYTKLRDLFGRERPTFARFVSADRLSAVDAALVQHDEAPLLALLVELQRRSESAALVERMEGEFDSVQYQHARYDGALKGTEVGMVLFYTDLLAKLWALDYLESAPDKPATAQYVEGFVPLLKLWPASIYDKEASDSPGTRLWFGLRDNGFAKTSTGLAFAPIATRVYAASSNTLTPGEEAEANAESAAFLGWWNDHYVAIADYEPEYHRLNQIMKWSVVLAFLHDAGSLEHFNFLGADRVAVSHDHRFATWARNHPDLRFTKWDDAKFLADGYQGSETEALEILVSRRHHAGNRFRAFSGGVSLAERRMLAQRPALQEKIESSLRRPSTAEFVDAATNTRTLKTLEQNSTTAYSLRPTQGNAASVEARALRSFSSRNGPREVPAKLRGFDSELAPGKVEVGFARTDTGLAATISTEQRPIARLSVARSGASDVDVVFSSLSVEQSRSLSHSLGRTVARGGDGAEALALRPDVKRVLDVGDAAETLYVESIHGEWFRISAEGAPKADIAPGVAMRAAGFGSGPGFESSPRWNVAFLDAAQVDAAVGKLPGYRVVESGASTRPGVAHSISTRGPPSKIGSEGTPRFIPTRDGDGIQIVGAAEGRTASLERANTFLQAEQFSEARLELDLLAKALPTDREVQSLRAIVHAASESKIAMAEAARLQLTPAEMPAFLGAADTLRQQLNAQSAGALQLDVVVRGVLAKAEGHNVGFLKWRGEPGIEVRLSEAAQQSVEGSAFQANPAAARYTEFSPVFTPGPQGIEGGSIVAKLEVPPAVARYLPERLVDAKTGRTLVLQRASGLFGPEVRSEVGGAPPPPAYRARFGTPPPPCQGLSDEERAARAECQDVYLVQPRNAPTQ